jgi:hypothetical protein
MALVDQQMRKEQLHEIRLCTNALLTEHLRFYQKLGFEGDGQRVEEGDHRVVLRKGLVGGSTSSSSCRAFSPQASPKVMEFQGSGRCTLGKA